MRTATSILRSLVAALIGGGAVWAAEPAAPTDGSVTNELLFKKRIRRRYEQHLIVEPSAQAPAAPVPEKAASSPAAPDASVATQRGSLDLSTTHRIIPPPLRPERVRRPSREAEDDWTLTPEQRLARELKRISGEEDDTSDTGDQNWMARDLVALEQEQKSVREKAEEAHRAERETEQIAEIMGRDLLAGLRSDPTTTAIFSGDERARSPRPSLSTSAAPSSVTASREPVARTDAPVAEPPRGGRAAATRSPPERTDDPAAPPSPDPDSKLAADILGGDMSRSRAVAPTESPSVGPQLFKWSSSSGSGFAGLPSSLAPSVAPSLKTPAAPLTAPPTLPSAPSLGVAPPSWSPSAASLSSWSPTRPALSSFAVPPDSPSPTPRAGSPLEPVRTPFLNSTPAVLPSRSPSAEAFRRP